MANLLICGHWVASFTSLLDAGFVSSGGCAFQWSVMIVMKDFTLVTPHVGVYYSKDKWIYKIWKLTWISNNSILVRKVLFQTILFRVHLCFFGVYIYIHKTSETITCYPLSTHPLKSFFVQVGVMILQDSCWNSFRHFFDSSAYRAAIAPSTTRIYPWITLLGATTHPRPKPQDSLASTKSRLCTGQFMWELDGILGALVWMPVKLWGGRLGEDSDGVLFFLGK